MHDNSSQNINKFFCIPDPSRTLSIPAGFPNFSYHGLPFAIIRKAVTHSHTGAQIVKGSVFMRHNMHLNRSGKAIGNVVDNNRPPIRIDVGNHPLLLGKVGGIAPH